jgi:hypothetical protein
MSTRIAVLNPKFRAQFAEAPGPGHAPRIELGCSQGVRESLTPPKPPASFDAVFRGRVPRPQPGFVHRDVCLAGVPARTRAGRPVKHHA